MVKVTDQLIVEKKDGVGRITFDNQAKRNALTYEMWQGLPVVLDDFASDSAVRVIVLSGAGGKAFSAGADISQFEKQRSSGDTIAVYDQAVAKATNALVGARKPLIARIDGFCIGGGLGVAMCCDLRIAAADSRFGIPAAKLGLGYKLNGLKYLIDVVGPSAAMEILHGAPVRCRRGVRHGTRQSGPATRRGGGFRQQLCPHHRRKCAVDGAGGENSGPRGGQGPGQARPGTVPKGRRRLLRLR